jgi:hypothetical protein
MKLKPIMPFLPLPVRVTNEYVDINLHLSPRHAPDAFSASLGTYQAIWRERTTTVSNIVAAMRQRFPRPSYRACGH